MSNTTRYDALRNRIKTHFSRNRTYSVDTGSDSREVLFNLGDPDAVGNDNFLASGPFNFVTVRNFGDADARVYFSSDREVFVDVPASSGAVATLDAVDTIPKRYVSFVEVENLSGADPLDLEIQVGNTVDSVELDLLSMAGLLDVEV